MIPPRRPRLDRAGGVCYTIRNLQEAKGTAMLETFKTCPFWRTRPEDADAALDAARRGAVRTLCRSAGGRTIRYLTYGEKPDYNRRANYSSACGARDARAYADREGRAPTILLLGATHGQETEGVAALLNLISLLETGRDLRGEAVPSITDAFAAAPVRLVIVPIYNLDGRARCAPDAMLGESLASLRYHGQGTWRDGSLCGWPDCKKVHPIKDAAGHLGAYYNDDGVNLMHDNFFSPMAPETRALLQLCDEEAPECVVGLHGGANTTNELLQPDYVPRFIKEAVFRLASDVAARQTARGLKSHVRAVAPEADLPPPSFNLTSALHHVSGAVSSTYESNEGLDGRNAFTAEEILLHHYCLFESLLALAWRE